jgi:selenocysteine-specific elongation factor
MAGHGTIVTGTLRHGNLFTGDKIAVLPSDLPARVRGLQVHGAQVAGAAPGQRVAVNLRGLEPVQAPRGAVLAGEAVRGCLVASAWLSVALQSVKDAPDLRSGARLHLLAGTFEVEAQLRLLDRDLLAGGECAIAQLHCARPVILPAREHFILRGTSPPLTVAGGRILEPEARRLRRGAPAILDRLSALAGMTATQIVLREVEWTGQAGTTLDHLARLGGVAPARAAQILLGKPVLIGRNHTVVALPAFEALLRRLPAVLADPQAAYPDGMPLAHLQAKMPGVGKAVLDEALARLAAAGKVHHTGGRVRLRSAANEEARERTEAALAFRLAEAMRRGGLHPPGAAEIAADPQARRMLERLIREGVLMRLTDHGQKRDVLFHRDAVETARRQLALLLANGPGLMVTEIGAALGVSRKFSVPLLEYLDTIHFTRRVNDRRVLGPAPDR